MGFQVASVPQRCARLEMANDLMGVKVLWGLIFLFLIVTLSLKIEISMLLGTCMRMMLSHPLWSLFLAEAYVSIFFFIYFLWFFFFFFNFERRRILKYQPKLHQVLIFVHYKLPSVYINLKLDKFLDVKC